VEDTEVLIEMRCRACGTFMGYRRRIGRFVFWCNEACAESPMAKFEESQVRDEVIVELFLSGQGIMDISRLLNNWPYQYVQGVLARRGLQEFMVKQHTRLDGEGEEHVVKEHRVLVRTKAS
jgi:hypothetical protein